MEHKTAPAFTKSVSERTVTGIFCVHGNIDDGDWLYRDRSHPGALADTAIKGRERVKFLWGHKSGEPPIAVIDSIRELGHSELPSEVLSYASDATGGVEVTRTYLETPRGNEVLTGIKAGAIEEMSYGYDIASYSITEDDTSDRPIRELLKLKLWDISDVTWGMNGATVGSKGLPLSEEHDTVLAAVRGYIARLKDLAALRAKDGRVLSGENRKRVESALEALSGAIPPLEDLLAASEPKQARPDVRQLLIESQRIMARLNGVT